MDVEGRRHSRHRLQLGEVDRERVVDEAVDGQVPLTRRVRGHVADVEHWEAFGEVLARRQSARVVPLLDQFLAIAIEESHASQSAQRRRRYNRGGLPLQHTDARLR